MCVHQGWGRVTTRRQRYIVVRWISLEIEEFNVYTVGFPSSLSPTLFPCFICTSPTLSISESPISHSSLLFPIPLSLSNHSSPRRLTFHISFFLNHHPLVSFSLRAFVTISTHLPMTTSHLYPSITSWALLLPISLFFQLSPLTASF